MKAQFVGSVTVQGSSSNMLFVDYDTLTNRCIFT